MKSGTPKVCKSKYNSSVSTCLKESNQFTFNEDQIRGILQSKISNHQSLISPIFSGSYHVNNYTFKRKNQRRNSVHCLPRKENKFILSLEQSLDLIPELKMKKIETQVKDKIIDITVNLFSPGRSRRSMLSSLSPKNKPSLPKIQFLTKEDKILKKRFKKYRKLHKKKLIYDSMEETETDDEKEEAFFIFDPQGRFLFVFDFIILVTANFIFWYLSINFARVSYFYSKENIILEVIQYMIDLLFVFDIIITFFRGYYDRNHCFIKNKKSIIYNYIKHQLLSDILSGIPVYIIKKYFYYKFYTKNGLNFIALDNEKLNERVKCFRFLTLFKIIKIFKIMNKKKNIAMNKFSEYTSKLASGEKIYSGLLFVVNCLIYLHLLICTHIYIGKQTYPNWISYSNMQDSSFILIYITSLYYLIETMTTVGYGDMANLFTITSIIFQIIILSVGIIAYSWIITILGTYVKNESRAQIKYNQNLLLLEEIRLEHSSLPFKLYNKIHRHLESSSEQQNKCDLNVFINSLPYSLKNEMLFTIYDEPIKNFKFFKENDVNSDFILRVLSSLIPLYSKKNAILMREGEIPENIVFVKNGELTLEAAIDKQNLEESILNYLNPNYNDKNLNFLSSNSIHCQSSFSNQASPRKGFLQRYKKLHSGSLLHNKYIQESFIHGEIGKIDLGLCGEEYVRNGNYKFLHVLNIYKNEYIGIYYLFKNKQIPLSLKVKSKIANIFLLRKNDAIKMSVVYPTIWSTIVKKAEKNAISLEKKMLKKIKNYCEYKGFKPDLNKVNIKQSKVKMNLMNIIDLKEILQFEKEKLTEQNRISKLKKNNLKQKSNENLINLIEIPKTSESNESVKIVETCKTGSFKKMKKSHRTSTLKSKKNNYNKNEKFVHFSFDVKRQDSSVENEINNTTKYQTIKSKKNNKNHKTKKYYKMLCAKLIKKINILKGSKKNIINISTKIKTKSEKSINSKSNDKSIKKINFLDNSSIKNETEDEINLSSSLSSSKIIDLQISIQENFTFNACYPNLNELSKGQYISNILLQKKMDNFIKEIKENYNNKNSFINSSVVSHISSLKSPKEFNQNFNNIINFSDSEDSKSKNSINNQINKVSENKNFYNDSNLYRNNILNSSYQEKDSNITEKSDLKILQKIKDENYEDSDFISITKKAMSRNRNNNFDNNSDNFVEYKINGSNGSEFIKNESIKKLMFNKIINNTTNNVYKIKQINSVKADNNFCQTF